MKRAINEGIPGMNLQILETIKFNLKKFFPEHRFFPASIELSSDSDDDDDNELVFEVPKPTRSLPATIDVSSLMRDDDDENLQQPKKLPESSALKIPVQKSIQKRTQKTLGSIAEYKTKSLVRFRPSSSYAKPSENENNRTTLTVPYKTPIAPKPSFDPRKEAEKLSMIKEKIYLEKYIKIDQTRKEEIMVNHQLVETNTEKSLDLETMPCLGVNQRAQGKSNDAESPAATVSNIAKLSVVPAKEKRRRRKTCFLEEAPKGILKERRNSFSIDTNNNLKDIGNKRDSLRLRNDNLSYNESTDEDDEKDQEDEQKEQKLRKTVKRVRFADLPDDVKEIS